MDSEKQGILHEFFAVTMTSVYHVRDERGEETGEPNVEKVAVRGESHIPVGEKLHRGNFVAITARGLMLYGRCCLEVPHGQCTETHFIGGHTSPIVALFLSNDEAMRCLTADHLKPCDSRWEKETLEVLRQIGNDHPVFTLAKDDDLRLPFLKP